MSDYLDNLLIRNTPIKEGVRPRPVSLFESLPGTRVPVDAALGLEADEDEPAGDTRIPGPPERGGRDGERLPAAPESQLPRARSGSPALPAAEGAAGASPGSPILPLPATETMPRQAPAPASRAARTLPESLPLRAAPEPARQPGSAEGTPASYREPAAATRPLLRDSQPGERTVQEAHPVPAPLLERTVIERIVPGAPPPFLPEARSHREMGRESPAAAAPAFESGGTPPPTALAIVPAEVVVQPQIRPAPAPTPSSPAQQAATAALEAAPEPTIQVTIGRIEVRATQAPTPARRPAPRAQPALSLEEYLRQRKGGAQ